LALGVSLTIGLTSSTLGFTGSGVVVVGVELVVEAAVEGLASGMGVEVDEISISSGRGVSSTLGA
jgi:hypothetical protein